jgi:hypothetical protein
MYKAVLIVTSVCSLLFSAPTFAKQNKEWNRGCSDAKKGYYDNDRHPQAYKDGQRACENTTPADTGNDTPRDLSDLVNGRRVGGEVDDELTRRGYKRLHDDVSGDDVYSYWKKPKMKNCVVVHLDVNRAVSSVAYASDSCNK